MSINFTGGWVPTPASQPRVRFTDALRTGVAPAAVNYGNGIPVIGMHLNDQWGCCTIAADANIIQQQTWFGQHAEITVPDSAVLAAYEKVGGFNPAAGPPGSNPTDNGATVAAALGYLKKTGLAGRTIAAYGDIEVTALEKMKTAIWEFGCLSVGLNLPNSAVTEFDAGEWWSVEPGNESIDGGHCVLITGYDPNGFQLYTWDRVWYMSNAFWSTFGEEAWAPVSTYWVNATSGKDPAGVDKAVLGGEFLAITGQNPFAAKTP